ncbi:archaeosortase/exosortase family protein [Tamlana sp. I1]|uniref:archaeosortase/exosortase family protein n=1 Tax=Tamlana sp. I1 TaxID=2762061 RepID=UPI00188FE18C|nr:archaeosortase/exosortase family protein [Tamlana sp. I1]
MLKINSLKNEIPLPIRLFLGRALLFYIVWEIIYGLFIYDSTFIDRALTSHVGESSVSILNNMSPMSGFTANNKLYTAKTLDGEDVAVFHTAISHNNRKILNIANVCNGLTLMALYIGFIVCIPEKFWRKIKYIILGIIIIDFINILRCVGLIYLREYFHAYFDFAHHYLFKAIVYASTFIIWTIFARKINLKHDTLQNG